MPAHHVTYRRSAEKELRRIGSKVGVIRILKKIDALAVNPRPPGSLRLTGTNAYRVRQGNFRIVYTIEDQILTIEIIKIGDREDVYS